MKRAFVTGWPISHSKSPVLHGYWLKTYGIDGTYEAVAVSEADINTFFTDFNNRGFVGGNITIPHKEAAFKHFDNKDAAASKIGAVNTVWIEDQTIRASNTDAYGFSANLDDHAPEWRSGKNAVVLGAGGAARAVVYALQDAGYDSISIANRTVARARSLADHFGNGCSSHDMESFAELLADADMFVNTTSIGMAGEQKTELPDISNLSPDCLVTDIVYTPLLTPILEKAKEQGNKTVDGLGMLLHQAVPGFEKWFGIKPEVTTELRKALLEAL